jgi:hypothetical protein
MCLQQFSGNGFQPQTFPFLWVPEHFQASGSRVSQQLNPGYYLTHSLTHNQLFTACLQTNSRLSQNYFTTGVLPPISSTWCQAPLDSRPEIFLWHLNPYGHTSYVTSCLTRGWACVLWIAFVLVKRTYTTYSILLKNLPFALYTSPLSVQALQSKSCLSHLSYATMAT